MRSPTIALREACVTAPANGSIMGCALSKEIMPWHVISLEDSDINGESSNKELSVDRVFHAAVYSLALSRLDGCRFLYAY